MAPAPFALNMGKTRILVMGAGLIGVRHIREIQAHEECTLAGVVEIDSARCIDDGVCYFHDLNDVDVEVDGVIIATPNDCHRIHGVEVAKRGWHVLVEKPVAQDCDEAAEIEKALNEKNLAGLVGHHRRYHDSIGKLKALIEEGLIGQVLATSVIWAVKKNDDYFEGNWRTDKGSPIMINLIHDLDLLRYVLGEIEDAQCFSNDIVRNAGRVETGSVALKFASGISGAISFSDAAPSPWSFEAGTGENPNIAETGQDMWWIMGSKGSVSYPSLSLWSDAADWSQAPEKSRIKYERVAPLRAQLDHFLAVIRGEETPKITVGDAAKTLSIALRIDHQLATR